jgi:hypothetical protein
VTIQPCYFTLSIIPNKIKRDDLLGLHKPGPPTSWTPPKPESLSHEDESS